MSSSRLRAVCVGLVLVFTAACGAPTQPNATNTRGFSTGSPPSAPGGGPPTGWCIDEHPSAAVTEQLVHDWMPPTSAQITDLGAQSAPSDDGWMFVSQRGREFNGAALWNVRTNKTLEILEFENPAEPSQGQELADQAFGSFDGRYVVFMVSHSPLSYNDYFSTFLFDMKTKKLTHLDDNGVDAKGVAFPSPATSPVIVGDYGAWLEGKNETDAQIAVVKLSTGSLSYIPRKAAGTMSAYDGKLLISEMVNDAPHWSLLNLPDGSEAKLPPLVEERQGHYWLTGSDSGALAYSDDDLTELWYSSDGSTPAQAVPIPKNVRLSSAFEVTDVALIFATQGTGSYYVDTTTGRGVNISSSQFFKARGHAAITIDASTNKSQTETSVRIVDLQPGQITSCRSDAA